MIEARQLKRLDTLIYSRERHIVLRAYDRDIDAPVIIESIEGKVMTPIHKYTLVCPT